MSGIGGGDPLMAKKRPRYLTTEPPDRHLIGFRAGPCWPFIEQEIARHSGNVTKAMRDVVLRASRGGRGEISPETMSMIDGLAAVYKKTPDEVVRQLIEKFAPDLF